MLKRILAVLFLLNLLFIPGILLGEDEQEPAESESVLHSSIALSAKLLIPISDFSRFYDHGSGVSLDLYLSDIISENITGLVSGSVYTFHELNQGEGSLLTLLLSLNAGYSFEITDQYTVLPLLGFGYMLNILSTTDSRHHFFNPVISLKCSMFYNYNERIELLLAPGYNIYFERGNTGQFLNFDIGIKLKL
jgi:hypothetical protein